MHCRVRGNFGFIVLLLYVFTIALTGVQSIKCLLANQNADCETLENKYVFNDHRPKNVEKAECVRVCCYREDRPGSDVKSNRENSLCFVKPKHVNDCKDAYPNPVISKKTNKKYFKRENYYEDTTCKFEYIYISMLVSTHVHVHENTDQLLTCHTFTY